MLRRLAPTSLTGRLVATAVGLVALLSILIGTATTLAMGSYLHDRLDHQVTESLERSLGAFRRGPSFVPPDVPPPRHPGEEEHGEEAPEVDRPPGDVGTVVVYDDGYGTRGIVVTDTGARPLSSTALAALSEVPRDGEVHGLDLPALGSYRLAAADVGGATVLSGLPTKAVGATLGNLVGWEVLLTLAGVTAAGVVATAVVRRQLAPLREVADTAHDVSELPLATGAVALTSRVPQHLTDPRTEVGQVGAALNKLLGHVEDSLDARHRSEQQVRQFVADASHELRTPLATIQGYAELSRRGPADPATMAHALGKVEAEATRMSALVEDLLLLARLDAGRPLRRERVDLTRLVLEGVADARVLAPDHRWALDLPEEPVGVVGDEDRLHQVLTNLLTNARRHTPPGTTVTVGLRRPRTADGQVGLVVHDTGPGIDPDLQPTVFERFARGDGARTRTSGGAGLGLSLVEAIIGAHGGTVEVRSLPGDTTFTVSLPVSPDNAHDEAHDGAHDGDPVRRTGG